MPNSGARPVVDQAGEMSATGSPAAGDTMTASPKLRVHPLQRLRELAVEAKEVTGPDAAESVQRLWAQAETVIGKTGMRQLPGKLVSEFAKALEKVAPTTPTAEAALRRAVIANPGDRELLNRWQKLATEIGQSSRIELLLALQDENSELIRSAIIALLEIRPLEELQQRYAGKIASFLGKPAMQALARLWQAHGEGQPLHLEDAAAVRGVSRDDVGLFFLIKSPTRSILSLRQPSDEFDQAVCAIGLDPRCRDWIEDFLQKDVVWRDYLAQAAFSSADAEKTVAPLEDYVGFQDRIIRDQEFGFKDPFSGETCYAIDSWQKYGRTCYMFRGSELFYVISGGSGSKAFCIYVPKFETVLDFRAGLEKLLKPFTFSNTLAGVASRLADLAGVYNSAITAPKRTQPRRRKIVLSLQRTQNFAHHYWNFYTGLERIVLAGNASHVSRIQFSSSEFFGRLDHLFPEFAGKLEILDNPAYFDPCPFSEDELLVTVGGYAIPQTLLNRTRRAMAALPVAPGAISPETVPPAWPVVWIGMRLGDKSWVTQERDIPILIDRLAERFPGLLVLLDGFSFPVGIDQITHKWADALKRLNKLAEAIRSRCAVSDRVISMVGNSLRESVLWAKRTHAYLTPIGTTQHKIGWFTKAPGIVYLPDHGEGSTRPERMPGAWEAQGSTLPRYILGENVAPGQRRGINDQRVHLDNVHLDLDAVFTQLVEILSAQESQAEAVE